MKLTAEQKNEIMEVVAMSFETGHFPIKTYFDFKEEFPNLGKEAWEYYTELANMGPAGFYEEFKDDYDFDPDFVAEFGYDEEEEYIDRIYHDCSEEELRAMGCFDNLNDEEDF